MYIKYIFHFVPSQILLECNRIKKKETHTYNEEKREDNNNKILKARKQMDDS